MLVCTSQYGYQWIHSHWQSMNALLAALQRSSVNLVYFSLVMILFVFMYAIAGRQLFAGRLGESRAHFDTFSWALVTVFQVQHSVIIDDSVINDDGGYDMI
jgi:hypothetical protein